MGTKRHQKSPMRNKPEPSLPSRRAFSTCPACGHYNVLLCRCATMEPLTIRAEPDQRRDMISRTITLRADTLDEAERSVEAVMSTADKVTVYDWNRWGMIDEVLLSRGAELPEQIPLLETHQRHSIDDVLGSVRRMRIEGDQTVGRLVFARDDPRADASWNKVRQGHVDSVSVGYRSIEFTDIEPNSSKTVAGREYKAGPRPLRITTRWQVRELSLVPIGADPGAKIREEIPPSRKENLVNPKLRKYLEAIGLRAEATDEQIKSFMDALGGSHRRIVDVLVVEPSDDPTKHLQRLSLEGLGVKADEPWKPLERQETPPATPPGEAIPGTLLRAEPLVDEAAIRQQATADERTRVEMIRRVVGDDGDDEFVQRAISEGWNEERTASAVLTHMRENRTPAVGGIHSREHETDCTARSLAAGLLVADNLDPTKCRYAAEVGQDLARGRMLTEQDADLGDRYRDLSAVDICREACRIDGGRVPIGRHEAIRAATSGGTLSYIFGTNVYAQLIAGWEEVGDSTQGWCDEEDVPNFLTQEDISIQASARLQKLPRGDTAKHATISDTHETYKIARYAKQFVIDEQDIIDDRLGALMRMPREMGEAARKLRPDMVYSLMLQNPTLVATSGALFNATAESEGGSGHANQGAATLSSTNIQDAYTSMGKKRINKNVLNIVPKYLIVPAALEWLADTITKDEILLQLFADSADPKYSPRNPIVRRGLTAVMDDRLGATGVMDPDTEQMRTGSDTAWYLAAGGSRSIRVAYLRGTGRSPQLRSFALDRGQWGLGWDIKHDLGAAPMDYRGWYKSTGAG